MVMKPNFSLRIHTLASIVHLAVAAFHLTNETDYQGLLAFKGHITSDPSDVLSSWNHSVHFCDWTGVRCGKKHQRVTAILLPSLQLVGALSPHIWNLTFLRVLDLQGNHLNGVLPEEIAQLTRLQILGLTNNSIEGELPRNFSNCADLRELLLNGNNLQGQIPAELGNLIKLTTLLLEKNQFTGQLPPALGNLSALTKLSTARNHIQGTIPSHLGSLSNLEEINLGGNNLSGHIPTPLYNISSIHYFALASNSLGGTLPPDIFSAFANLHTLYLGLNQFSGSIPSTITNASQLQFIDMGANYLVGPIPVELGGHRSLQLFNFERNFLGTKEGDDLGFITSLTNYTKLQVLSVFMNRLKGILPSTIANFSSSLTQLFMGYNFISGTLPSGVGSLVNVQFLYFQGNGLSGTIPSSITRLQNLLELSVSHNNLSGAIPFFVGNLTSLSKLFLENNMLEGTIPASIGNCTHLSILGLDHNHLVGTVPQELFSISSFSGDLFLAANHLTGPIPFQIGKLVNLDRLDVSENDMSGEIPSMLGDCAMLELLQLGGNKFVGSIPPSMSNLRSLTYLNLSRNNFSGEIPRFLADLPFIKILDLSFNEFEGEVPNRGIFLNLSAFSVDGNNKLCGGPPDLQLPKCEGGGGIKHKSKKTARMRTILVIIIIVVVIISILVGIAAIILCRSKRLKIGAVIASSAKDHHPQLSYGELSRATDGFSGANIIGEGSCGVVYKGVLSSNGQDIAVKVLKLEEESASKSFMAECKALRNVRHRNLVKIITVCSTVDFRGEDFKALVFEFMPNGSLGKWIHPVRDGARLSVSQRLNIAIDVAAALDYLHHQCHIPVAHSDLKPSNILLDNDFCPRVSDFGLAKFLAVKASGTESSSMGIRGTIGYVAPEYGVGGKVSPEGDIYSFGIILLELFTGKRPTAPMFSGEHGLREFVERSLPDGLNRVLDPWLCLEEVQGNLQQCMISILKVGLLCSDTQPNERMDIREAVAELKKARNSLGLQVSGRGDNA
ncbi:hypothetical protein SAY87_024016 [Trapa incisa]|uniref:non-specific serine/threonine protein kinase n=1 Tax=Trapa incisa TaxID=236973 RepID=A0AAN7KZU7_9MYRT|nr:hypothetical protein SAY87_024016 [Trapa incisa]